MNKQKITDKMETKKTYTAPIIELVLLDNEISLALESNPPLGPEETSNSLAPELFNNNPLNNNLA
jgi:hypothetical protein